MKKVLEFKDHPEIKTLFEENAKAAEVLLFKMAKLQQQIRNIKDEVDERAEIYWGKVKEYVFDNVSEEHDKDGFYFNEEEGALYVGSQLEIVMKSAQLREEMPKKYKDIKEQGEEAADQEVH